MGNDSIALIYVAYAVQDKKLWEALRSHLSTLQYRRQVHIVDARRIAQGQPLRGYMERAQVILLLLSPAFMQSSVCIQEMEEALERRRLQAVSVLPVRLRPLANWDRLPVGELEALPPYNQSVQTARQRDAVLVEIVETVSMLIATPQPPFPSTSTLTVPLIDISPAIDADATVPRASMVAEIYAALVRPGSSAVFLTGLSGIGKTVLAVQVYQYAERQRLAGDGLFGERTIWLQMSAATTLATIAETLCYCLHREPFDRGNGAPSFLAQKIVRMLDAQMRPRLIVLDQFEALLDTSTGRARNQQDGVLALLQLLTQRSCRCKFLLVSRFPSQGMGAYPQTHVCEVEARPLDLSEGTALLRSSGIQEWTDELQHAVEYCQGHAQALLCLSACLKLDRNVPLAALSREAVHRQRWVGETALEYSYMHQLNPEQRLLLRSFALYRLPVPENAVLEMVQLEDQSLSMYVSSSRRRALDTLLSLKLLVPARPEPCYAVPSVVAEVIRASFQQEQEQAFREAQSCAANYYLRLAANRKHSLVEHRQRREDVTELIEATWHLCQAGQYEQAYNLLREEQVYRLLRTWGEIAVLWEIYQQFLNWPQGLTAGIYNELGEIALMQGKMPEARTYFVRALALCSATAPDEERVIVLTNLGGAYRKLGQLEEAQNQYQEALHICEDGKITAEERGVVLNNLGSLLHEQGSKRRDSGQADDIAAYEQAITYYERALALYKQSDAFGEAVRTLNNLGDAHRACQRNAQARDYYEQALQLARRIGARWSEAIALANHGTLCRKEGQYEQAQSYYTQALHIFRQIGSRWEEAQMLENLGSFFLFSHRYDIALACFIQACEIFQLLQEFGRREIPEWVKDELILVVGEDNYEAWSRGVAGQVIELLELALSDEASSTSSTLVNSEPVRVQRQDEIRAKDVRKEATMQHEMRQKLIELLLKVPDIEDYNTRTSLLTDIPNRLGLQRSPTNPYTDISLLVDALSDMWLVDGPWALALFVAQACTHIEGTDNARQLRELLSDLEKEKEDGRYEQVQDRQRGINVIIDQTKLRQAILHAYRSNAELKNLCMDVTQVLRGQGVTDLIITIDILEGTTLPERVLSLIEILDQRGYLPHLITAARKTRPQFNY